MAARSCEEPTTVRPAPGVSSGSSTRDVRRASAGAAPQRSHARAGATGHSGDGQTVNRPRPSCRSRAVDRQTGCAVRQRDRATTARWNEVDARAGTEVP